jgi:hypothetical protein
MYLAKIQIAITVKTRYKDPGYKDLLLKNLGISLISSGPAGVDFGEAHQKS